MLPGIDLDISLNKFVGKRRDVTQSLKSLSSERLECELALSTEMVDCVLHVKGESSAVKHVSVPQTEQDDKDGNKELLPREIRANFVILGADVGILNGLMRDSVVKPLSLSRIEQDNKNINKGLLLGDIKDNCVILNAEVNVLRKIDDLLNDLMTDTAVKPLSVSQTEQKGKDIEKEQLRSDIKDNSLTLEAEVDILQEIDDLLNTFH
jgi:hypothetical protein